MRKLSLIVMLLLIYQTAFGDKSPNGKDYDSVVDGMYFISINVGSRWNPVYEKMLVDADYLEKMVIPDEVDSLKVTHIADYAFNGRVDLESLTVNKSMRQIGIRTFGDCKYLSEVDLTYTQDVKLAERTFINCSALKSLIIPKGLNGNRAFENCTGLEKVVFEGVPGKLSFDHCTSLTEVELIDGMIGIPTFPESALTRVVIPGSVEEIANTAFRDCSRLSEVLFAEESKLKRIGGDAFNGTNLSSINIPDSVYYIGGGAFANTKFTEFRLPAHLKSKTILPNSMVYNVGINGIFWGCTELRKLVYNSLDQVLDLPPSFYQYQGLGYTLYQNGTYIDLYIGDTPLDNLSVPGNIELPSCAFSYISSLKKVTIEDSTGTHKYGSAFAFCPSLETVEIGAGAPELSMTFMNCSNLKTVKVSPKNRTQELDQTFLRCTSLDSIYFPAVTKIRATFQECENLRHVELPELKTINENAFYNCKSLEEINFPNANINVTNAEINMVANCVFNDCQSLRKVYMPSCDQIGQDMFKNCESLSDLVLGNVSYVRARAFMNCRSLKEFDFSNVKQIDEEAFNNAGLTSVNLHPGIKILHFNGVFKDCKDIKTFIAEDVVDLNDENAIGKYSLSSLESLEEVIINGTITSLSISHSFKKTPGTIILNGDVNECAILRCDSIKSIVFNGDVKNARFIDNMVQSVEFKSIESYLKTNFKDSKKYRTPGNEYDDAVVDLIVAGEKVVNLEIPAGSEIQENAFRGMTIEKVKFLAGEGETTIGHAAFNGCRNLKEIEIEDNVTYIGPNAFRLTNFESIYLPDCVKTLGYACFQENPSLRHVTFSPNIKTIAAGVLHNCPKIENIIIPEGVESLEDRLITYEWNPGIKLISLPSTLQNLYRGNDFTSFYHIPTNVEVISWAVNPPTAGQPNFNNNNVHVPMGSAKSYEEHRMWMDANIIADLNVDLTVEASPNEFIFCVPKNNLNECLDIVRFIVSIWQDNSEGIQTEIENFELEAPNFITNDTEERSIYRLTVPVADIEAEQQYNYSIKGYTSTKDLIYSSEGIAQINNSSVNEIERDNKISIHNNTVVIGSGMAGKHFKIYSQEGILLYSCQITDNEGQTISIPNITKGLYIINLGEYNAKVMLK